MLKNVTQLTLDRLAKEPAVLQLKLEELSRALEEAVVDNCSVLLSSSRCLTYVERDVADVASGLSGLQRSLPQLTRRLQVFMNASGRASSNHAALHLLWVMQEIVTELVNLPTMIRNCCKTGLYTEALDLAVFAREQLVSLDARCRREEPLLRFIERQVEQERMACHTALLQELGTADNFARIVKLLGHLRRVGLFSEAHLRLQFIDRRGASVSSLKGAIETQCANDCVRGLCSAASLLSGAISEVATQYRAIFGDLDASIAFWLRMQVAWFLLLVHNNLALSPSEHRNESSGGCRRELQGVPTQMPSLRSRTWLKAGTEQRDGRVGQELPFLDAASISLLYRHTQHASCCLRRVGAYFFPAAVPVFEQYLHSLLKHKGNVALIRLYQDLRCYSWDSSALFRTLRENCEERPDTAGHLVKLSSTSNDDSGTREPFALLRHPPLCTFTNELLKVLNAALDFPLFTVVATLPTMFKRILLRGAYILESIRRDMIGQTADRQTKDEFASLCQTYANVLLPLLAADLKSMLGFELAPEAVFSDVKDWVEQQRLYETGCV
uniref:Conserved oligomeric Golgi complex subunit 8 n=1 Tax=Neospora caninum (strain Liverpool) TaxID=572307 RepID=A0A0F7UBQ4_NEOCL|nr:TPA: Conserved oligomeric Golgi complex component 8,related [Neospora caninum Liverpool]